MEVLDKPTAQRWVGTYVKDYGELPSETYEKTHRMKLPPPQPTTLFELLAILKIRPKFFRRLGATREQVEWIQRKSALAR